MKARTLLLMCGLSLAGAAAAEPIDAPLHGHDGWLFESPDQPYDLRHGHGVRPFGQPDKGNLRRSVPHIAKVAPIIPLPRPRPDLPEKAGAIGDDALDAATPTGSTAPMPQPTRLAAPGSENAPMPQPASALLSATEQGVAGETQRRTYTETPKWAAVEPVKDDGDAVVSIRDAGGGRLQIEAHDASVGQVLAALQESHLIQFSASDQLSRAVTGTYTGTLPQVLSRILDGSSYFLRETASGTELHAVDAGKR